MTTNDGRYPFREELEVTTTTAQRLPNPRGSQVVAGGLSLVGHYTQMRTMIERDDRDG